MTCNRSPCTFSSRVIGRSSQSGSPATGWFTLGTIGQMALTVSGHKCQHYSGPEHPRPRVAGGLAPELLLDGLPHVRFDEAQGGMLGDLPFGPRPEARLPSAGQG